MAEAELGAAGPSMMTLPPLLVALRGADFAAGVRRPAEGARSIFFEETKGGGVGAGASPFCGVKNSGPGRPKKQNKASQKVNCCF